MNYQSFKVGDYFDIKPTKSYGLTNDYLFKETGKTPVIVNSSLNNGLGGYTNLPPTEKGNMITFSDTVSSEGIFYQREPFIGYSHVQGLYPKSEKLQDIELVENTLLYIVTAFKKASSGLYDYGYKFTRENALNTSILLPVSGSGNPDWNYMNEYISQIKYKVMKENIYPLFKMLDVTDKEIINKNIYYEEIRLGDYFTINRGKRLKKADRKLGNLPFVTAGVENYGISSYIDEFTDIPKTDGPSISVDMFGWANAKEFVYGYDDHVVAVTKNGLNIYHLIYIAAAITKSTYNNGKYSWQLMITKDRLSDEKIIVPFDENQSDISWDYIENYIKNLINKENYKLENFIDQTGFIHL